MTDLQNRRKRRTDPKEATADEVLHKAVDLLKRRGHAERELKRKLAQRGYPAELIDAALQRCKAEGWIQDEDFARTFADELVRSSRYGRRRIVMKLQERGIDRDRAEQAVAEVSEDVDWVARAKALVERRSDGELEPDERAKLTRFLMQRGFDSAEISAALGRGGRTRGSTQG